MGQPLVRRMVGVVEEAVEGSKLVAVEVRAAVWVAVAAQKHTVAALGREIHSLGVITKTRPSVLKL